MHWTYFLTIAILIIETLIATNKQLTEGWKKTLMIITAVFGVSIIIYNGISSNSQESRIDELIASNKKIADQAQQYENLLNKLNREYKAELKVSDLQPNNMSVVDSKKKLREHQTRFNFYIKNLGRLNAEKVTLYAYLIDKSGVIAFETTKSRPNEIHSFDTDYRTWNVDVPPTSKAPYFVCFILNYQDEYFSQTYSDTNYFAFYKPYFMQNQSDDPSLSERLSINERISSYNKKRSIF